MVLLIAVILIFLFLIIGLPIAYSFLAGSIFILGASHLPLTSIALQPFFALDSFPLMAIPFFILAGNLMEQGGISEHIFRFINCFIGRLRGGLGATTVLACMFFGAISGSSVATVSAIGSLMVPQMVAGGYKKTYATALIIASGFLGVLIPPSIPGILYAMMAELSIAKVFLVTVGPGILLATMYIIVNFLVYGRKQPKPAEPFRWGPFLSNLIHSTKKGILALLMPVIILGGIYGGVFTPTEAAAVSVVYGFIVGFFAYRSIDKRNLYTIFARSALASFVLLIIVALAAGVGGRVFTILQIPQSVANFFVGITDSPIIMLLLVNILLLFLGMFLDCNTIILIFTPVLMEIAKKYGIDPYHFGAIVLLNVEIGLITPPMAANIFVGCSVTELTIDQIWKPLVPFLLVCFPVLAAVTYLPQISLFIPNLILGK
jgi:C4-dicarboxylate transporter DctM subunit